MKKKHIAVSPTIEEVPLEEMVGYNLRRAAATMINDFELEFSSEQLRPTTFGMLAVIGERPGINSTELGRCLGIRSANMAPLLGDLEKRGLIERSTHATDKRIQVLFLTESSKSNMPIWRAKAMTHEDRVLLQLTKADRSNLLRLLRLMWRDDDV